MTSSGAPRRLPDISSRAFEHPADRTALTAMRSVPGFDQLIRAASSMLRERQYRLVYLSSAVRVGERQFPDLHELIGDVCDVLDAPVRPEVYVYNDPEPNAMTLGIDRPFIAISSGQYELNDHDERRFVLGHEIGHAMSGHALYQSLLQHLLNLIGAFGWLPGGALGMRAIVAALREWQRKAELSGDRAGLLATQDLDAALRAHMKMAGGAHLDRIDPGAFLEQAAEYESSGDLRDGVLKLLNTERTTHPFAVVRAAELTRWAASEEYRAIVEDGVYPRRADDQSANFGDTAREAARTYRRRIDESTDPLVTTVRNVGTSVGSAVGNTAASVQDWFARRGQPNDRPSEQPPSDTSRPDGPASGSTDDIFEWFERTRRTDDPPQDPPPRPT